jgi:uncharacterized protein (TIGR00730 family)
MPIRTLCVFCGSNPGADPRFAEAARDLGTLAGRRGLRIVYGGGRVGLMGFLADAALAAGAEVIGVLPRALANREVGHDRLTELRLVGSMHERKALMAAEADGFLALPGGIGTLEEIAEMLTWAQLGLHAKPCALLDVLGFFRPLVMFLDHAVASEFMRREHRGLLLVDEDLPRLLDAMDRFEPISVRKWIDDTES